MSAVADTFKRNKALFLFLIGLVIVCAVIYVIREPLMPFALGFVFAYLTLPIVDWVDRKLPFNHSGHATQRIIIILVLL